MKKNGKVSEKKSNNTVNKKELETLSKYISADILKNFNRKLDDKKISERVVKLYVALKEKNLRKEEVDLLVNGMTEDEVDQLELLVSPYKIIAGDNKKDEYYCYSNTNIQERFNENFLMTSMIGLLYRYVDEKEPPEDMKDNKEFKEKFNEIKKLRREFLNEVFQYNPDFHTKSAYHENPNDPDKKTISKLDGKGKNKAIYNVVPSEDLFLKWRNYRNRNYEELREATMAIYPEKPDIEDAVIIYGHFDSLADAENFVEKNQKRFNTYVKVNKGGLWAFSGPFKQNRKRLTIYGDESTKVFQSIMERYETDDALGRDMMKKRLAIKKKENERKHGPDHENFRKHITSNPNELGQLGIKPASLSNNDDKTEEKEVEELPKMEQVKYDDINDIGMPENAIRVDILSIDAITNETEEYVMYTEADKKTVV